MTRIDAARHRMQQATDLPAVLDASYAAFEAMLSAIHLAQDPASDLFTAFVMAAASAANGRNALALAPSLPRHPLPTVPPQDQPHAATPEHTAEAVASLSHLIAARLTHAAASAPDTADQDACTHAARSAAGICGLLASRP